MPRVFTALLLMSALGCGGDETLPEILVVRDFALVSHDGEPFGSQTLEGHVYVVSFIFTACNDVCPLITNQVANLHRRVTDERVRFVSITVDPEVDTPTVLAEYAARYGADSRWTFLTGGEEDIQRVVTQGFRVQRGERSGPEPGYDIPHSELLLLVDQNGVLRGQYGSDHSGLDRIERDIGRLLTAE